MPERSFDPCLMFIIFWAASIYPVHRVSEIMFIHAYLENLWQKKPLSLSPVLSHGINVKMNGLESKSFGSFNTQKMKKLFST